jgi:hypothetical protein
MEKEGMAYRNLALHFSNRSIHIAGYGLLFVGWKEGKTLTYWGLGQLEFWIYLSILLGLKTYNLHQLSL